MAAFSKDVPSLMGGSKASLCFRSQEATVEKRLKPAKQGCSSDELQAFVI